MASSTDIWSRKSIITMSLTGGIVRENLNLKYIPSCARSPPQDQTHHTVVEGPRAALHAVFCKVSAWARTKSITPEFRLHLWCRTTKHRYFCASEITWPNFPRFLIPLVKMVIFIGRTKWPKRFWFWSKLTEFFFLDWPKLATWHNLVHIWKAISFYKQIINTFWSIIDLEFEQSEEKHSF